MLDSCNVFLVTVMIYVGNSRLEATSNSTEEWKEIYKKGINLLARCEDKVSRFNLGSCSNIITPLLRQVDPD